MMSKGQIYTLVLASVAKRALQSEMLPEMRLEFLSHLEKMADNVLTPDVIAMVEPIDDRGEELYKEACKLGFEVVFEPGRGRRPDAFDVLHQKFDVFAALNPSLQRAYDEACRSWGEKYVASGHIAGEVA